MANCAVCGNKLGFLEADFMNRCKKCSDEAGRKLVEQSVLASAEKAAADREAMIVSYIDNKDLSRFRDLPISTMDTIPGKDIAETIDVVAGEVVFGMHIFKDIAASWRDTFGGRSNAVQSTFKDARELALLEMRGAAWALGADAVAGVRVNYSEFSGAGVGGSVVVCAVGTAVRVR
jgi:uncharacterized protein YbjQ (UPF0145 family)